MRLLAAALQFVAGSPYRPRAEALEAMLDAALAGRGGTLAGAALSVDKGEMRIVRELKAVEEMRVSAGSGQLWDGRWRIEGNEINGLEVRALGTRGWSQIPDKREGGPRFREALSLPAVFRGETLVACAALGFGPAHTCRIDGPAPTLARFLLSH